MGNFQSIIDSGLISDGANSSDTEVITDTNTLAVDTNVCVIYIGSRDFECAINRLLIYMSSC